MNWRKPVILGLLKLTGSKIPDNLEFIKSIEFRSKEEIRAIQGDKLEKLLLHAHKNVPYYNKILEESGVVIDSKINLKNFSEIPILTKDIIRENFEDLKSKDLNKRKWYYNTSGGSTGEPVKFIQDREYQDWNFSTKIYLKTFGGQDIGDRELRLWGSERDILEGKEKLSIRLRNWLYNRKELNAFIMSEEGMYKFVREWNTFRPRWVEAYVQSIYEFARFIQEKSLEIYSPKGILTTAGTLNPQMKVLIEKVFDCKVFNRYGSREVGDIACSCEKDEGLHISIFNQYVEILNDDLVDCKPDQIGQVYVTALNNYAMPLVRYQIGDMAVPANNEQCSCGRGMPLVKKVVGRVTDTFISTTGIRVDGAYFRHAIFYMGWIKKYQIVQKNYNLIIYKIVVDKNSTKEQKDILEIERWVKKIMGKDCKVKFEFVDDIEPTKSGKYSYTICEVKCGS